MKSILQLNKIVVDFNLLHSNIHYFLCKIVDLLSPKKWREALIASILLFSVSGYTQTETFNNGMIPPTWAITGNQAFTNNWVHTATEGLNATGAATVDPATNNTIGTTAEYFLITPQLVTPANGEIRFYTKQGVLANKGTTFQLRISTANQPDISSFNVVLQSWTEASLGNTTYQEKIVPIPSIPAGIPIYVAFVAITNQTGTTGTAGDKWFVDNVRLITACAPVTGITTTVGGTSATISWTHPTANNFGIEVVPAGAGHGSVGTPVTGTTYTATGLTPATSYDVYIRTICDSETSSTWAGPFQFTTAVVGLTCPTAIVVPPNVNTTPFTYSTNLATFYDADTYVPLNSQNLACSGGGSNYLLGNHAYFSFTPATTGLVNITQSVNAVSGGGGNNCYNDLTGVFVFNGCAGVGTSAGCLGSIRTGTTFTTSQLSNFYVTAGTNYIIIVSSPFQRSLQNNAGICFTLTISGSNCPAPALITLNDLGGTSASASWNNVQNLVSAWDYVALPSNAGPPSPTTIWTSTNTNVNNIVSGLTPGTMYNLYVRSVCSSQTPPLGTPGTPLVFTTQCAPLPIPYYTGFTDANATNPEPCWTVLNLNNDLNKFEFGAAWNNEPVAKCRTQNSNEMLVSPQFHLVAGGTQKRLRFKFNNYGNWGLIVNNPVGGKCTFEVRLSTTGVGSTNFNTVLIPQAQYTTAYNFVELIVPIPDITGDINIAWVLPPNTLQEGNWFYVDDVYIEDMPACSEPSYPVITPGSITNTSLELSWTNGYNNTQWQIVAQPQGTGTPTTSGILVDTNPYVLTDLIPSTRYEIYVRAYCNETDQSIWVGPIFFHTLCDPQPVPYYESLNDSDPNTKKFCWSIRNIGDDNTKWRINANDATVQANGTLSNPFSTFDDWLVSGPVNAVGFKRLRYNYRAVAGIFTPAPRGNFEVLMSTSPDFTTYTTIIASHDFTNTDYLEKTALFTGTGVVYIAFRVPPTMTNPANSGVMYINDVTIDDAPACPFPTGLTATNPMANGITLGWTPGYLETAWEVTIQEPGEGIPTTDGVAVETTPSYVAGNLQPNTQYEYYVRAVCDTDNKSDWRGPFLFRTDCVVYPSPFIETFEPASPTKTCWKITDGNVNGNTWQLNSTVNPIFGEMDAAMLTASNGNNNDWLVSPTITVQPNQRLRFYYKAYGGGFEEDLKVMLSTTGSATTQFTNTLYENSFSADTDATGVVVGSYSFTLASADDAARVRVGDFIYIPGWPFGYPPYVVSVVGNVITLDRIATITQTGAQNVQFNHEVIDNTVAREMVINLTDITVPTNINIGFYIPHFPPNPWNYRGQMIFIDDFTIEDIPACPSVINVTASNIVDTTAAINWEPAGTETSWEISIQPYGTPAPVGPTLPEYLVTASTHPKTITDLTPSTLYQYYVRAICSGTSQSEWVGPFEILTKCDYSNVCQYTITTISGTTGEVTRSVNVMQNGSIVQQLEFPGFGEPASFDNTVFLCSGVAFDLYWDGQGSGVQYSQAQIIIKDELNNVVWTSPLGLGDNNTIIYSGFATCGAVTCPQPTNLTVNNQGVLSWTPGGTETQWEVFVQPYQNGTIPQLGNPIINTPSYTPSASDFSDPTASTYEYFVRAVCGPNDKSYWSGPKVFIRNNESSNALRLQVNDNETCNVYGANASFIGATASPEATTCEGVNGGDIWFDFVATSKVHFIEIKDLAPGSYYTSSYEPEFPRIMMSLYQQMPDNSLVEMGCSDNNSFVAIYSTELVVGNTYKIRLKLNNTVINNKTFSVCITTPNDMCDINAFNYDFEKPPMQEVTGVETIMTSIVVPGWRTNTDWGTIFFQEGMTTLGGYGPYSGGQSIQITADGVATWNPNDPNIKGLYKDFDTSELTEVDYSFASATRTNGSTLQLYAGPPSGPFTLVTQDFASTTTWELVTGTYAVPVGQPKTRFIFRPEGNAIGLIMDAANFKAPVDILTDENLTLDCSTTTTTLSARGIGHWEADVTNPTVATIATPGSTTTAISGITLPGNYIFHWKTRYCDKTITITKQANLETPVVVSPITYCLNATASPLTATVSEGNTLMWYTVSVGGTGTAIAPTPITTTAGNSQVYYVSSVDVNGCEGPRAQIVVQVNDLPTATISGTTAICSGATAVITFNGTPSATVTYTVDGGTNQTIVLDATTGIATLTTPALTLNSTYTLVSVASAGTPVCSQAQTGSAFITINSLPTATISSGTTTICSGGTAVIVFNGTPSATVTYTVDGGTNQTIALSVSGFATLTTPILTLNSTYTLVSVASEATSCSQAQTGSVVITVTDLPTATISGTTTICSGGTAVITFNGPPSATVTYTVDGGVNQTIVLDATGIATLTTPVLTLNSTYTLVSVSSAGTLVCSQALTGSAIITINDLPTATISGTTTICSGATAVITFNGTPNATVTYTVDGGTNQTIVLDATTGIATLTTPILTSNSTYTLVSVSLVGTSVCSQAQTGSAIITVNALPTATISAGNTICTGTSTIIIINGTPNATVTYTVDGGANQTIVLSGSGFAALTTPVLTLNSTYTLVSVTSFGTPACSQALTGSAIITVNALPAATISGTTTICSGTTAVITFNGTPSATVTYTVDGGVNQTIVLDATGTATLTTPVLTLNSTYTLVSVSSAGTPVCSQALTGSAIITINDLPTATISGTTTICSGTTAVITFNGTPNATVTYTVDGGTNQTIVLDATGTAALTTPVLTLNSTYTLVSVASGTTSCSQTQTGSATVTVNALPTVVITAPTSSICTGTNTIIIFNGTPNATVTYTIDGGANQTIVLNASGVASVTTPLLTVNSTYTLVSATTTGTTTCSQTLTGSVVITVNQLSAPNVVFSYPQTCVNASANPLPVLTPNFVSGGVYSSTTATVNPTTGEVTLPATVGPHVITYTLDANTTTCTAAATSTATLVIAPGVTSVTGFSYDENYCLSSPNALPVTVPGFTPGGIFTVSPSGLIINPATGEITISGSPLGTYTVTYTVASNSSTCESGGSSSFILTISGVIIDDTCQDQELLLEALPVDNSFNPNDVTYTWSVSGVPVLGSNTSTFNVDNYLEQNPSVNLPLVFSVSVTLNGDCVGFGDFEVTYDPCKIIPRGISPNDDGDNDTFDLTGMGVKEITIFNRYGTNVFSYSGTYTNQWKGQSDQGDELPDGTYFYSIHIVDGVNKTGWVYINRQY